jgi:glyoxylase-like metal-dependent hydrolase (beta-lactamase superfamily II)
MDRLHSIDLGFLGLAQEIGVYLFDTPGGPALFDCGPASTLEHLRAGLDEHGLAVGELRHLLLSHIHLDHAGATGALVHENPELTVWVSPVGAPHLIDPEKLVGSARRLFPNFDELWGPVTPVPEQNLRVADGDVLGWEAFPTPGHASHHVAYFRDGTLLAGDAAGVRIVPSDYVQPVAPPPDIDIEAWQRTIDEIERRAPRALALIHFGIVTDVCEHLRLLRAALERWSAWVRDGMTQDEFVAVVSAEAGADAERYSAVFSFGMSWLGLRRYWDRRASTTASYAAT